MAFSLPYRFVTLSAQQIEDRREILNRNGFYAWLSPIIVLAIVGLCQILMKETGGGSSLPAKRAKAPTSSEIRIRRLKWWLSTPLSPEFGPRQVHLLGGAYATWLLILAARRTSDDYMHITKQLGHVAVAQLPMHYLLAVKSPMSPIQRITTLSHETLLPYHRIFGRIIHLFFLAHGILYMNFFKQSNLLPGRLASRDALIGLLALALFNILGITSIPPIRKAAYHNAFYMTHVVISMLIVPVIFFHVPYTRLYVAQCFLIGAFNAISRKMATTPKIAAKVELPADDSNIIRVALSDLGAGRIKDWIPGQHCYLKQDLSPMLPRSPFTIVSSTRSNNIELVLRNLGGPLTKWVAENSRTQNLEVMVEGPYGESASYVPSLTMEEDGDVLLVAGGIGATFTVPIYLTLLQEMVKRKEGISGHTPIFRDRKITFLWVVKSKKETFWALRAMADAGISTEIYTNHGINIDMRIYITNKTRPATEPQTSHFILDAMTSKNNGGHASHRPRFDFPPTGNSVTNELAVAGGRVPRLDNATSSVTSGSTSVNNDALSISTKLRTSRISSSSISKTTTKDQSYKKISTVESDIPPSPPRTHLATSDSISSSTSSAATTSPLRSSSPSTPPTETEAETEDQDDPASAIPAALTTPTGPKGTSPSPLFEPPSITAEYESLITALLPSNNATTVNNNNNTNTPHIQTHNSARPDIPAMITELMSQPPFSTDGASRRPNTDTKRTLAPSYAKVTVLACGPPSLVEQVRGEVGKHVLGYGREVDFRSEGFGHG